MDSRDRHSALDAGLVQQVLGYLNFSSGSTDPQFLTGLNHLYEVLAAPQAAELPTWRAVSDHLEGHLDRLEGAEGAFSDTRQARRTLTRLVRFMPTYRAFHEDLLWHQSDEVIFNSYFFGRATEVLLSLDSASEDADQVVSLALRQINDYVGYRPVATLESQKIEPYKHEWVRPVPLFLSGAGVAPGKYQEIITQALDLLQSTDAQLLRQAYFDPNRLEEVAFDPRAYDFDHPANKRPNYHFGQWDPHRIDGDGFYRRFVIQQVTIDCLLRRVEDADGISAAELVWEAAAVLAGTMLMSSGISGFGPETHVSTVSLAALLAHIATYRDEFYQRLLQRTGGSRGARLREEASRLQQPFAGARQDLNRRLTECRAIQLQRIQLARIYARMNYPQEALSQSELIQVPSARLSCQIDCKLTQARASIPQVDLATAFDAIQAAQATLLRGIQCGAIVDPWNILGFDGNFCLFGSIENSLRDYRIDDLVDTVEEIEELYSRLWSKAAATHQDDLAENTRKCFHDFANWWHQFAAHELDSVETENPLSVFDAAHNVAVALHDWHQQGEASGDIGFWAPHVQKFDTGHAYWLVINTLLARDDKVATLGLLMHWLSQSDRIPLEQGEMSFYRLALQWLAAALDDTGATTDVDARTGWKRIRQFFDYLEANAGDYWQVPVFSPDDLSASSPTPEEDDDEEENPFEAAYEGVVYRDSTDDGMESSIFDFDTYDEDYLQQVSKPIITRITFVERLSLFWKVIAVAWSSAHSLNQPDVQQEETTQLVEELLNSARDHLAACAKQMDTLLESVSRYRLTQPGTDPEAMVDYDRLRLLKDSLLDQIMNAHVAVTEGYQFLAATVSQEVEDPREFSPQQLLRACIRGDKAAAQSAWPTVRDALRDQPILYVPLNRGGPATTIVEVRARQQLIQNLLFWLPRIGLLQETYELIELVRTMELTPVGLGAITEFDDLFEIGCQAAVNALIDARNASGDESADSEQWLVSYLEEMMEPLLRSWLSHSRTLRLSVLEQLVDDEEWQEVVQFIRDYGRDLFTQRFLNLGNIRGILHQGVDNWVSLVEEQQDENYEQLIDALAHGLDRHSLVEKLTLILEAIVENYSEYRDYNSTTTQSDRGDLLFTLIDFLRLRVSYDRVVWNLRPVVLAHQVLARRGCEEAASQWRRSLMDRIRAEAQVHVGRLHELEQKYAMQLPSISKRLSEKFMRPLMIDYLCSLVEPAATHADADVRRSAFQRICEQAETFLSEPSGAGLDVPNWLLSMEEAVRGLDETGEASLSRLMEQRMLPPAKLSIEEIQSIISTWHGHDADNE